MGMDVFRAALMRYLSHEHPMYYAKIVELRDKMKGWLSYIPQTFPHYTRHTVDHSDEIVVQLSLLLFEENDPMRPAHALNPAELVVLLASAYLHDAGMVVSDGEKVRILESDSWQQWAEHGSGAKRWLEIKRLIDSSGTDDTVGLFVAGMQTRFLIAEYVRRTHHERSREFISLNHTALTGFFSDPQLLRTVSDVCVSHGLHRWELDNHERYPERRDIQGYRVNVRLLAVLLRLGDLLDMSNDRACPLLLNAACPLPADSLAHWSQYQRIVHRTTAPDCIEITAECETQEEHRVLRDWCEWLVDEVHYATVLLGRCANPWRAPRIEIRGQSPTIVIRPSQNANYIPCDWIFELDQDAVLSHLINDVHGSKELFIRELLQNAFDATRCKMYDDLSHENLPVPAYPSEVPVDRREKYPIRVSLREVNVPSALTGEPEARQILSVDDAGIGMNTEVVTRYFLQVGRSFYTTYDFQRQYRFVPASRFGVGFMTVFAASDDVTVDTFKPISGTQPLRLRLTGPRSYLLTERGSRTISGTRIDVVLREPLQPGQLSKLVSQWCRRVEFPILVDDLGLHTIVTSEQPEQFIIEQPDRSCANSNFVVRMFPIDRAGIEGEIYVFAHVSEKGESWGEWDRVRHRYASEVPLGTLPPFPGNLSCVHGLNVAAPWPYASNPDNASGPISSRVDFRGAYRTNLSRSTLISAPPDNGKFPEITSRCIEILEHHLKSSPFASGPDGWAYKQSLVEPFSFGGYYWDRVPETIRVHVDGHPTLLSFEEATSLPVITTVSSLTDRRAFGKIRNRPTMVEEDIHRLCQLHRARLFSEREITKARFLLSGDLALDWTAVGQKLGSGLHGYCALRVANLPNPTILGVAVNIDLFNSYECVVLNAQNPLVQWFVRLHDMSAQRTYGLNGEHLDTLGYQISSAVRFAGEGVKELNSSLTKWADLASVSPELVPPIVKVTRKMCIARRGYYPPSLRY